MKTFAKCLLISLSPRFLRLPLVSWNQSTSKMTRFALWDTLLWLLSRMKVSRQVLLLHLKHPLQLILRVNNHAHLLLPKPNKLMLPTLVQKQCLHLRRELSQRARALISTWSVELVTMVVWLKKMFQTLWKEIPNLLHHHSKSQLLVTRLLPWPASLTKTSKFHYRISTFCCLELSTSQAWKKQWQKRWQNHSQFHSLHYQTRLTQPSWSP